MSNYKIKDLQEQKARKLGVTIKPSTNKLKKIDVYKDNKKIASIGAMKTYNIPYGDYASYILSIGITKANIKRNAYLARHSKYPKIKNGIRTNSFWADNILW